jgi:hypothetical protein
LDLSSAQMHELIYSHWWWPGRLLLPICVALVIVGHMTYRIVTSIRDQDND